MDGISNLYSFTAAPGHGGDIVIILSTVTPGETITYAIGAGGAAGTGDSSGGAGGRGEIILEY